MSLEDSLSDNLVYIAEEAPKYYKDNINNKYRHQDYLYINELFYSIQGEGLHTGIPMFFVRLQGCEVGCYFCDTKESWRDADENKKQSIWSIFEKVKESETSWMCITGGEPYEQDFYRLTELANQFGIKTHVETSGTVWRNIPAQWITLSPKDLFSKKKTVEHFKFVADEIKCVVTKESDLQYYHDNYYGVCHRNKPFIFQIVDNKTGELLDKTLSFMQKEKMTYARIMMQQHKVFKLR